MIKIGDKVRIRSMYYYKGSKVLNVGDIIVVHLIAAVDILKPNGLERVRCCLFRDLSTSGTDCYLSSGMLVHARICNFIPMDDVEEIVSRKRFVPIEAVASVSINMNSFVRSV